METTVKTLVRHVLHLKEAFLKLGIKVCYKCTKLDKLPSHNSQCRQRPKSSCLRLKLPGHSEETESGFQGCETNTDTTPQHLLFMSNERVFKKTYTCYSKLITSRTKPFNLSQQAHCTRETKTNSNRHTHSQHF